MAAGGIGWASLLGAPRRLINRSTPFFIAADTGGGYSYTAALKGAKYLYSKETLPRRLGATITPALLQTMNPVLLPTIRVWRNKDGYSGVNLQR